MEELRDANGMTEAEFLASYDASKYDRPSVTVDLIIIKDNRVLLVRRGGHPCIGKLAFPGGFVEMNEDVYTAAARELKEETNLTAINLRQLGVASFPKRDPRTRIITVPFLADVADENELLAGDDAMSARWYSFSVKRMELNATTVFEVNIAADGKRESFKVTKIRDKSGVIGDAIYKQTGASPLAGDHAEIFVRAFDALSDKQ
jgi:ADP-ribose pyrophosphatase YjhB (NUDIX family)